MNTFEEIANKVIDEVCDVFLELYPTEVKQEFLDECESAAHIYGEAYYTLESRIADIIKSSMLDKLEE
jgi:hypothetical protein